MDYLSYQRKINDVITKCPIEAGIEILVSVFLDKIIDNEKYTCVAIDRLRKDRDSRLSTEAAVTDLAILSPDFEYRREDVGKVYGFIEVKAPGVSLESISQIEVRMKEKAYFIYTNGIIWKCYFDKEFLWKKCLIIPELPFSKKEVDIDKKEFDELKQAIQQIEWSGPPKMTS